MGEQVKGKKAPQMAKEYGVGASRVRQWAQWNNIPFVPDKSGNVLYYYFNKADEKRFAERDLASPGRPKKPKAPKVRGKVGRPRKEKPVDTEPKRPVGRPRKNPAEILDVVPKRPRGRPRK
jgi:transposase